MIEKLGNIGFYTLSDSRVMNTSEESPMKRCEVLLTGKCNFKCPYCRGLRGDVKQILSLEYVKKLIDYWTDDDLENIRFSGGEPTLHPHLKELVSYAKSHNVNRIAVSTNGSASLELYKELIKCGVNDYSISLDACCASYGYKMCGVDGMWEIVVKNIEEISKLTYVTVGMVFTDDNINEAVDTINFADSLGVTDIRIVSAAQYNAMVDNLSQVSSEVLNRHPILKYRVNHYLSSRNVRGMTKSDYKHCALVLDDSAVAGDYHFPCIIYLREGGDPIGRVGPNMRVERTKFFESHNTFEDPICRENCLDVCIDYNNRYRELKL